jgi:hypothetical protein
MRSFFASLVLLALFAGGVIAFQPKGSQTAPAQPANLVGRWRVKFNLSGIGEKNLIFDAQARGAGSFLLLDAGPNNKPAAFPVSAAWSDTTNNRVSFSGEVELPLGTCCREIGTLVFKGKLTSNDTIAGKTIFIGITEDEENFNGFRSGALHRHPHI